MVSKDEDEGGGSDGGNGAPGNRSQEPVLDPRAFGVRRLRGLRGRGVVGRLSAAETLGRA